MVFIQCIFHNNGRDIPAWFIPWHYGNIEDPAAALDLLLILIDRAQNITLNYAVKLEKDIKRSVFGY